MLSSEAETRDSGTFAGNLCKVEKRRTIKCKLIGQYILCKHLTYIKKNNANSRNGRCTVTTNIPRTLVLHHGLLRRLRPYFGIV